MLTEIQALVKDMPFEVIVKDGYIHLLADKKIGILKLKKMVNFDPRFYAMLRLPKNPEKLRPFDFELLRNISGEYGVKIEEDIKRLSEECHCYFENEDIETKIIDEDLHGLQFDIVFSSKNLSYEQVEFFVRAWMTKVHPEALINTTRYHTEKELDGKIIIGFYIYFRVN